MKGTYYRPMPVDHRILGLLPEVGTIGGVHWRGRLARDIASELADNGINVTTTFATARLKSLEAAGYVRTFPAKSGGLNIWAKTESGIALQRQQEEEHGA